MTQTKNTPTAVLDSMLQAPSVKQKFEQALGKHADEFMASITELCSGDVSLQACDQGEVVKQALKAANLKLPIIKALGFSYLVVYNNNKKMPDGTWQKVPTPTFVLGYKGYIQLAMRTGQYKTLNCDVVYDGQLVGHNLLSGEIELNSLKKKSDKVVGYFAYYRLLNGMEKTFYMSVEDMAAYAKRYSPSVKRDTTTDMLIAKAQDTGVPTAKSVGWEGNFTDMALKTCVRRLLSKYGYLSIEMQTAMGEEATAESAQYDAPAIAETASRKVNFENAEVVEAQPDAPAEANDNQPDF